MMTDDEFKAKLRRSGELRDEAVELSRQGQYKEAAAMHDEATRLLRECEAEVDKQPSPTRNRELGQGLKPVRLRISQCHKEVDGGFSFVTEAVPV